MKVLGFDPGTQVTGWGVVRKGRPAELVAVGAIRTARRQPVELRLQQIYREALAVLREHAPDVVAVEDPFVGKNPANALTLGQARGVLLLAATEAEVPVVSYAPRLVKSSVAGRGSASKQQVQYMVQGLLKLAEPVTPLDASDAVAVALCHLNRAGGAAVMGGGAVSRGDAGGLAADPDEADLVRRWKQGKG